MDLLLAFAGLSDVVGGLHSHERIHLHSEGFLDAERHVPGKVSLAVEQAGQRGPGNMKRGSRRRYREARGFDNLRPNEISGMGRVLHTHGVYSFYPSGSLLNSGRRFRVLSCRYGTSSGDYGGAEAPCALAVAGPCAPSMPPASAIPRGLACQQETPASCGVCPPYRAERLWRCLPRRASPWPCAQNSVFSADEL